MHGGFHAPDWSAAPLRELIRHIVLEYHDCLRLELPELARRMGQEPAARAALRTLQEALDLHLGQQEEVLFPAIRNCEAAVDAGRTLPARDASTISDLILRMKQDQQRLVALLNKVREQVGDDELLGLRGLHADLQAHVQLEDDILFQRALRLVSPVQ